MASSVGQKIKMWMPRNRCHDDLPLDVCSSSGWFPYKKNIQVLCWDDVSGVLWWYWYIYAIICNIEYIFRRSKWHLLRRYGWRSRYDIFHVGGFSNHLHKIALTMRNLPQNFCEKTKACNHHLVIFSNNLQISQMLGRFAIFGTIPDATKSSSALTRNVTSSFTQNHGLIFEGNHTSSTYGVFTYIFPLNYLSHPHSHPKLRG